MFAPLAQLVRARSLYLRGPWFESMRAHTFFQVRTKFLYSNLYTSGVLGSNPRGRTKHGMFCAGRRHGGAEAGSRKNSAEFYG